MAESFQSKSPCTMSMNVLSNTSLPPVNKTLAQSTQTKKESQTSKVSIGTHRSSSRSQVQAADDTQNQRLGASQLQNLLKLDQSVQSARENLHQVLGQVTHFNYGSLQQSTNKGEDKVSDLPGCKKKGATMSPQHRQNTILISRKSTSRKTSNKENELEQTSSSNANSTTVYVWGADVTGSAGTSPRSFYSKPKAFDWQVKIKMLSCGKNHAGVVTTQGQLYMMGSTKYGKLGLIQQKGMSDKTGVKIQPTLVESLQNEKITQVSCGSEFTVAVTSEGQAYSWGQCSNGALGVGKRVVSIIEIPSLVEKLANKNIQIQAVSAGQKHTLFLDTEGNVYGSGHCSSGQLGVENSYGQSVLYEPAKSQLQSKIVQVAAGENHSLYLTESGTVYSSGDNSKGQCGLEKSKIETVLDPTQIMSLQNVVEIKTFQYSLALTASGDLYQWGSGVIGDFSPYPMRVPSIGNKVKSTAIGRSHLAAVDESGMVWTWGQNRKGELGLGDYTQRQNPYPLLSLKDKQINNISIGDQFSIAFVGSEQIPSVQTTVMHKDDSFLTKQNPSYMLYGNSANQHISSAFLTKPSVEQKVDPFMINEQTVTTQQSIEVVDKQATDKQQSLPQQNHLTFSNNPSDAVLKIQENTPLSTINSSQMQDIQKLVAAVTLQRDYIYQLEQEVANQKNNCSNLEMAYSQLNELHQLSEQNLTQATADLQMSRAETQQVIAEKLQLEDQVKSLVTQVNRQEEAVGQTEQLQHELGHTQDYLRDAQKQIALLTQALDSNELTEKQRQEIVQRLDAQIQTQNQQIVKMQQNHQEENNLEMVLELDQAKLMLEQGALQRDAYEKKIEELQQKLAVRGNEKNKKDIFINDLQRKILTLEQQLSFQISLHEETKREIDRLDLEITKNASEASKREQAIAFKLEQALAKHRDDANAHQQTKNELHKYQNMYNESLTLLRQEQNEVKLLQMENQTILNKWGQEKNNGYRMKRSLVSEVAAAKTPKATRSEFVQMGSYQHRTSKSIGQRVNRWQTQAVEEGYMSNQELMPAQIHSPTSQLKLKPQANSTNPSRPPPQYFSFDEARQQKVRYNNYQEYLKKSVEKKVNSMINPKPQPVVSAAEKYMDIPPPAHYPDTLFNSEQISPRVIIQPLSPTRIAQNFQDFVQKRTNNLKGKHQKILSTIQEQNKEMLSTRKNRNRQKNTAPTYQDEASVYQASVKYANATFMRPDSNPSRSRSPVEQPFKAYHNKVSVDTLGQMMPSTISKVGVNVDTNQSMASPISQRLRKSSQSTSELKSYKLITQPSKVMNITQNEFNQLININDNESKSVSYKARDSSQVASDRERASSREAYSKHTQGLLSKRASQDKDSFSNITQTKGLQTRVISQSEAQEIQKTAVMQLERHKNQESCTSDIGVSKVLRSKSSAASASFHEIADTYKQFSVLLNRTESSTSGVKKIQE